MILNRDDYRYFFGGLRVQPRAIIPASGPPILIGFESENVELKRLVKNEEIKLFSHVGQQISSVREVFHTLFSGPPPGILTPKNGRLKIGVQMWFHTPAFLIDLFRKVNPNVDVVPSDPVMDELRMVKDKSEIDLMIKAQAIAAKGMNTAKQMLLNQE